MGTPSLRMEMWCRVAGVSKTCAGVMAWHRTAVCCTACLATATKNHCSPQVLVPGHPQGPPSARGASPSHTALSHGFWKALQQSGKSGHSESSKRKSTRIINELESRSQRKRLKTPGFFNLKLCEPSMITFFNYAKGCCQRKGTNYSSLHSTRRVKLQQGKFSLDIREIFVAVKTVQH